MFDRCISFTVTYFPEDGSLIVDCLNCRARECVNILNVSAVTSEVSAAAAYGICQLMNDSNLEDFFEVK